jgi:hypothetical protein
MLDLKTGQPRWSPDGRYLAAMPADSDKLLLFDFTTRKWAKLAMAALLFPTGRMMGSTSMSKIRNVMKFAGYQFLVKNLKTLQT